MNSFIACLFSVFLVIFCSVNIGAEENSSVEVPQVVIVNQVVESPLLAPAEELPIVVNEEVPLKVEMTPVLVNQEAASQQRVIVESVAPLPQKISTDVSNSSFSRMKQLAGRWEGSGENTPGEKQDKIVVVYEITAGGNAVLERIFPGTSQEMVTMYYEEKGKLTLMHFCLIGTRSLMTLKPFSADSNARQNNVYEFSLIENPGLDSTNDTHMHSLKIVFVDENHMNQEWEMFEAGKSSGNYSFVLARVPDIQ